MPETYIENAPGDWEGYIILGTTSDSTALAIGNAYGKPFRDEEQAERRLKKLDADPKNARFDFLVLPLHSSRVILR